MTRWRVQFAGHAEAIEVETKVPAQVLAIAAAAEQLKLPPDARLRVISIERLEP